MARGPPSEAASHWDRSDEEMTLGHVLADQVDLTPAAVAVIDGARARTYRELDIAVSQLANGILAGDPARTGRHHLHLRVLGRDVVPAAGHRRPPRRRARGQTPADLRLWRTIALDGFDLRRQPGDHQSILMPPQVDGLAAQLDAALRPEATVASGRDNEQEASF